MRSTHRRPPLGGRRRNEGGGPSGISSSSGANRGVASSGATTSRSPKHDAMADILETQERIARSRLRAPGKGWVVRQLKTTSVRIKKKSPLLHFVPAERVRLEAEVPRALTAELPPGNTITVSRVAGGGEVAHRIEAPSGPRPAPGDTLRLEIQHAALPPRALGEPRRVELRRGGTIRLGSTSTGDSP